MPQDHFNGRASVGYQINGAYLSRPEGGWKTVSADSPHGRSLISYFRSGVGTNQASTWFYQNYADLRCMKYGKPFRDFKSKCVKAYKKEVQTQKKSPSYREAPSSGDESLPPSTPNMSAYQDSDEDNGDFFKTQTQTSHQPRDAPGRENHKVPVFTMSGIQVRDKRVGWVITIVSNDTSVTMCLQMYTGQSIEDFTVQTHETNKRRVIITSTSGMMGDEERMSEVFVGFDENDAKYQQSRHEIVQNNGGTLDQNSNRRAGAYHMAIDLDHEVEANVADWKATMVGTDGTSYSREMNGMMEHNGHLFINWKRIDATKGKVNSGKAFSSLPMRASRTTGVGRAPSKPFKPQPGTFNTGTPKPPPPHPGAPSTSHPGAPPPPSADAPAPAQWQQPQPPAQQWQWQPLWQQQPQWHQQYQQPPPYQKLQQQYQQPSNQQPAKPPQAQPPQAQPPQAQPPQAQPPQAQPPQAQPPQQQYQWPPQQPAQPTQYQVPPAWTQTQEQQQQAEAAAAQQQAEAAAYQKQQADAAAAQPQDDAEAANYQHQWENQGGPTIQQRNPQAIPDDISTISEGMSGMFSTPSL